MRGRGSDALAAGERAATVEAHRRRSSTSGLEHPATRRPEQRRRRCCAPRGYWELRAAQESLAILERSVTRQGDLLRATTTLVNGGELARVELARSQAGEARARPAPSTRGSASTTRAWSSPTPSASPAAAPTRRCRRRPRIRFRWRRTPPRCSRGSARPPRPASAATSKRRCAARKPPSSCSAARRPTLRSRLDLSASLFYTALGEVGDVATEDQDEANALRPPSPVRQRPPELR